MKRFSIRTSRRIFVLAITAVLLVGLSGSATALSIPHPLRKGPGDGKFHVVGTDIIGPNGGKFVPRGVNLGGLEWTPTGFNSAAEFDNLQSWGVNFVRVALSDVFWLKSMCSYSKTYATKVDQVVKWAEQRKMLVLLDDHHGTQGATCGTGKWATIQKMPDVHNLDFIKQLATKYKSHPYVAFDLYNEPHDISDSIWRSGGIVDGYRAVGMQPLLDGLRSTGATNLVFATGNGWGNDLRMIANSPLNNDHNVVYATHAYPYWCDGKVVYNEPYVCRGRHYNPELDDNVAPVLGKRAVMLAEFGTYRANPAEMAEPIQWAENHHIGWSAWLWCSGTVQNYCLVQQGTKTSPSVIGQPVRDALHRATGK